MVLRMILLLVQVFYIIVYLFSQAFPTNLRENIPLYQAVPDRLINYIKQIKQVELSPSKEFLFLIFCYFVRYVVESIKEIDNLLLDDFYQQNPSLNPNHSSSNQTRRERLMTARLHLKKALEIIEDQIQQLP